jgi:hypothetical protein
MRWGGLRFPRLVAFFIFPERATCSGPASPVQHAEEVKKYQNADRHSEQPQQQIAAHGETPLIERR